MNILPLLTLYLMNSKGRDTDRDMNLEIADSLYFVIEKFIMPKSDTFLLEFSNERDHSIDCYMDVSQIILDKLVNIKTQIIFNNEFDAPGAHGARLYNVLLIDSWKAFERINPASSVADYDRNEFYYIYLHTKERYQANDMQKIFEYCWKNNIINVNIQVQSKSGDLIVYTYFPFAKTHCRKVIPVEINRFDNGTMQNKDLFPSKLLNLHMCPLRVATWHIPPFVILDLTKKGREAISGFEGKLLRQLSEKMNFDIEVVVPPRNERIGVIHENYSTGAANMLRTKQADLSMGCIWFSENRSRTLTATDTYLQTKNMPVIMEASSNLKPDHALWFPFEPEASIVLLTAFIATLVLYSALTALQAKFFNFIPANNPNVFLSHIAYTLGIPPAVEPLQNSKRIFVTTWVLFALVIRTKYGAIIYHLIRNNIFMKPPSTIDEVMKLNYTFVLNRHGWSEMGSLGTFKDMRAKKATVHTTQFSGVFQYLERHSNEKLLTAAPMEFLLDYLGKNRKIGVLLTLKEAFMNQNVCIYLTKHSFLSDQINTFILLTNAVGVMDAWVEQVIDFSFFQVERPPKAVTIGLQQLDWICYLCGCMLVGALVVFFLEILSVRVKFLRKILE